MSTGKKSNKVVHLLHEAPPDKLNGIGNWVNYSILRDNKTDQLAASLSLSSHRNYVGGVQPKNWIRTAPPNGKLGFREEILDQNEKLSKLLVNSTLVDLKEGNVILHCHDWLVALSSFYLAQTYNLPMIGTIHSLLEVKNEMGLLEWGSEKDLSFAISLQNQLIESATWITTFDNKSLDFIEQKRGRNCTNIPMFPSSIAKSLRNNDITTNKKYLTIGFIGRFTKDKGCLLLAEILKNLNFNFKLILAGEGPLLEYIHKDLKQKKVDFFYAGYTHDTSEFFSQLDILVVPSLYDPGPLVVAEAVFAGVPVVASKNCGIIDYLSEFEEAIISVDLNPIDFSSAISSVASNLYNIRKNLKKKLSNESIQNSLDSFSTDKLSLIYQALAQKNQ